MIFIVKYEISKEDLLLYKNILQKIKLEDVVSIDTQVTQPHDKTIKKILEEKEEVAKFLKQYIKIDIEHQSKVDKKMQKKLEEGERRGEKRGKKLGMQENLLLIVKNMLRLNEDEDKIIAYTNATKADIEKAKRTLKMQNA